MKHKILYAWQPTRPLATTNRKPHQIRKEAMVAAQASAEVRRAWLPQDSCSFPLS
jgi:hypothetical protein